jgi:hypothetical protein
VASTSGQIVPPPQMSFVQPQIPLVPGSISLVQSDPMGQAPAIPEVAELAPVKPRKCWKCSVDTHATKDCKVYHY